MRTSSIRRALLAGAAALGLTLIGPLAAQADDAFRFWSYYQWDGDNWAFAPTGPADTRPADGDVEGWRFAVAGMDDPRFPRAAGDFDLICGSADAADGEKRVAVVVDFGTPADAEDGAEPPAARGSCAVVPEDATGADVLTAAVGEVRYGDGGFTCGIAGYPATGCGGPVEGEAPTGPEEQVDLVLPDGAASGDNGGGVPVGVLIGAGAVVVIGGGAVFAARRSRAAA